MHIAVVGPTHPYKGGVSQHTTALAYELAGSGHAVELVSWGSQYPTFLYPGVQHVAGDPEFPVFDRTRRKLHWARPWTWVFEGARLRRADLVVIAHVTPVQVPAYLVLLWGGASKARVAVVCHNVLPHETAPLQRPIVRWLLRRADVVLTHSASEAASACEMTPAQVKMVPLPPFGPAAFKKQASYTDEVHRRLLFFGLVRPYKGLDVLLKALALGPGDLELRVAGEFWNGGVEPYVKLCRELGIEERVELIPGYVPAEKVPDLFAGVDALVLPYRSATGSQGPLTAFERGIPVITSNAGPLAAMVRNGVDGLVTTAGDHASLAHALVELYSPGRLAELRANVVPPDKNSMWHAYVDALSSL